METRRALSPFRRVRLQTQQRLQNLQLQGHRDSSAPRIRDIELQERHRDPEAAPPSRVQYLRVAHLPSTSRSLAHR